MTTPGQVVPEQEPEATAQANLEVIGMARGELRAESVANHLHWAGILILWCAMAGFVALGGVWLWHEIASDKYRFLTAEENRDLQTVLATAVGSSFVTGAAKKWIGK
ncbi:MAG TPA: hypothetical protein VK638_27765 [Edaphobacter sp.]|nr:hypothetical protein [Edaphobacter sp.]